MSMRQTVTVTVTVTLDGENYLNTYCGAGITLDEAVTDEVGTLVQTFLTENHKDCRPVAVAEQK